MTYYPAPSTEQDTDLRQRAVKRLDEKRGLSANVLAYVLVNLVLVAIWAVAGGGFFWPIFPILGWGIGLAFHVWAVMWPAPTEKAIQEEMQRLRQRQD